MCTGSGQLEIRLLEPTAADDAALVEQLAQLVNDVYAEAETGLWREGWTRTSAAALADPIRAGQIALARQAGQVAGCVRVHEVADGVAELGLLVSAPDRRGTGVGSALVAFAEAYCRERGLHAIRLELLVPRGRRHPAKELLRAWYARIGYRLIRTADVGDAYPHLVQLLATPCDIETHEKSHLLVHGPRNG